MMLKSSTRSQKSYIKRNATNDAANCHYEISTADGHSNDQYIKGVLHPWALFLKTLRIFSKNKATSDKVSCGSGHKCSKEHKNHSFTSVETTVVKLQ